MFEIFKRWASSAKTRTHDVVLWVNLPEIDEPAPRTVPDSPPALITTDAESVAASSPVRTPPARPRKRHPLTHAVAEPTQASHRERLLAMRLEHLQLCPAARCQQLDEIRIQTAGDLVYGNPQKIAATFRNPARAERAIRRYRAAIKLAIGIDSMMPRDALLLVAIHRRSVASLSRESAAQLHRDLERFALSSRGSKLVGHRGIPSLRRVRTWVATCRELAAAGVARKPQPVAA